MEFFGFGSISFHGNPGNPGNPDARWNFYGSSMQSPRDFFASWISSSSMDFHLLGTQKTWEGSNSSQEFPSLPVATIPKQFSQIPIPDKNSSFFIFPAPALLSFVPVFPPRLGSAVKSTDPLRENAEPSDIGSIHNS